MKVGHMVESEHRIGLAGEVGAVEAPLIGKWLVLVACTVKVTLLPAFDSLTSGLPHDLRPRTTVRIALLRKMASPGFMTSTDRCRPAKAARSQHQSCVGRAADDPSIELPLITQRAGSSGVTPSVAEVYSMTVWLTGGWQLLACQWPGRERRGWVCRQPN